jgi:hypothetical protein
MDYVSTPSSLSSVDPEAYSGIDAAKIGAKPPASSASKSNEDGGRKKHRPSGVWGDGRRHRLPEELCELEWARREWVERRDGVRGVECGFCHGSVEVIWDWNQIFCLLRGTGPIAQWLNQANIGPLQCSPGSATSFYSIMSSGARGKEGKSNRPKSGSLIIH